MIGAAALHKSAAGIAKLHVACKPLRRLCCFLAFLPTSSRKLPSCNPSCLTACLQLAI